MQCVCSFIVLSMLSFLATLGPPWCSILFYLLQGTSPTINIVHLRYSAQLVNTAQILPLLSAKLNITLLALLDAADAALNAAPGIRGGCDDTISTNEKYLIEENRPIKSLKMIITTTPSWKLDLFPLHSINGYQKLLR